MIRPGPFIHSASSCMNEVLYGASASLLVTVRWGPRRYAQRLPSQGFVELLQYIQGFRKILLVIWTVGMFTYQLAVDAYVEHAVGTWD